MTIKALLDFIAKPESGGDYNIVWGGIKRKHKPPKPLVKMTIGEVLAWQDSIDPIYMSEAAGRYQIMEGTLSGLYAQAGLTTRDLFNENNQDRLATQLLYRRGLQDYLDGRISANKFANSLAKEWASLPVVSGPKKGRSYYSGDGLNKSHVSVEAFIGAVQAARPTITVPPVIDAPIAPPATEVAPQGFLAALVAAILSLFGGRK